ncbi:MAG: hypothetical protein U0166_19050 [Acidobacteriota bacterium]
MRPHRRDRSRCAVRGKRRRRLHDSDKSAIAIQLADGKELSLHVVETTKIMVSGKAGALLDVKPKAKVTVTWTEEKSGDKVAQSISAS